MGNPDFALKLEAAEAELQDLKSNMTIMGKEAAAGVSDVEAEQQRLTLQWLIAMVESERTHHQRVIQILDQLEGKVTFLSNAESYVELNLSAGGYVVVQKMSNNGRAEGECEGIAGWFPFERWEHVLASKMAEVL